MPAATFATALTNEDDLKTLTDFLCILFFLDDLLDKNVYDVKIIEELFDVIVAIFDKKYVKLQDVKDFKDLNAYVEATFDIYAKIHDKDLTFFAKCLKKTFQAGIWEQELKGQKLSQNMYFHLRKFTGASRPVLEMIALLNNIAAKNSTRKNLRFSRLLGLFDRIIGVSNDILSLYKEIN